MRLFGNMVCRECRIRNRDRHLEVVPRGDNGGNKKTIDRSSVEEWSNYGAV